MQIPFVGSTYLGRSLGIDSSRSINFFLETTSSEAKSPVALVGTSGTTLWERFGTDPIRAMYRFGGYLFVVCGTTMYRIDSTGTKSTVGTLNTSSGPVIFVDNGIAALGVGGNQMVLSDGTYGYLYNLLDNTLQVHPSPNFPGAGKAIAYMDGYIIASSGNMGISVSELYDASTYNGLAIAAAIATPDNISSIVNLHQQLFIIKEYSTEVWYNAGIATQDGCPFSRVSGAVMDFGTLSPYSVARGNNSIFFLAQQRIGDGSGSFVGVVELNGYTPTIISPQSITYHLSNLSNREDAIGFCYIEEGHMFYQLTFPSENCTFVYDSTTKQWHERSTFTTAQEVVFSDTGVPTPKTSLPQKTNRHLGNCYAFYDGKHLVGDYRTGNVYEMSSSLYDDNGEPIVSSRISSPLVDKENLNNVFVSKLVVDAEMGVGTGEYALNNRGIGEPADGNIFADGLTYAGAVLEISVGGDPKAFLSWSNDGGRTWSNEYESSLGRKGEYGKRLIWRRIGYSKNRCYKITISSPVKKVITSAVIEVSQ